LLQRENHLPHDNIISVHASTLVGVPINLDEVQVDSNDIMRSLGHIVRSSHFLRLFRVAEATKDQAEGPANRRALASNTTPQAYSVAEVLDRVAPLAAIGELHSAVERNARATGEFPIHPACVYT
jgi:hypothetical protein